MNDIVIKKGTTLCVLVTDIEITLYTGELYELSNQDIVEFQVRQVTRNKKQVLVKRTPTDISLVGQDLLFRITLDDIKDLDCVAYSYDITLDLGGEGRDVFTVICGRFIVNERGGTDG